MKELTFHHRVHATVAGVYSNGLHKERVTVHAPTVAQLYEAVRFYQDNTREGMDTTSRINLAIALHEQFDAEARHYIVEAA